MCQHDFSQAITLEFPICAYKVLAVTKTPGAYTSPFEPSLRVSQPSSPVCNSMPQGYVMIYELHAEAHSALDTSAGIYLHTDCEKAKEQARLLADANNMDVAVVTGTLPSSSKIVLGIHSSRINIRASIFIPQKELIRYESRDKVSSRSF